MDAFFQTHVVPLAKNLAFAIIIFIVGMIAIRLFTRYLPKSKLFRKIDDSTESFIMSTIKILLNLFLIVIII